MHRKPEMIMNVMRKSSKRNRKSWETCCFSGIYGMKVVQLPASVSMWSQKTTLDKTYYTAPVCPSVLIQRVNALFSLTLLQFQLKSVRAVTEVVCCLCLQVWPQKACIASVGTRLTRTTSRNSLIKVKRSDTHLHGQQNLINTYSAT